MKLKNIKKDYLDYCNAYKNYFVCKIYLYLKYFTSKINLKIFEKIIFSPFNLSHKRLDKLYGDEYFLKNKNTFFVSKNPNSSNNEFHSLFTVIKNEDNSFRLMHCLEYIHTKFINEATDFQLVKEQLKIYKYSKWIELNSSLHESFGFNSKTGSLKKKFYYKIKL